VAQRVGRGIALFFHDRGTRRGLVVSITPRPHFTPRKDPVPILQEAGWAPRPVWTEGKSRPHRHSIPDRPVRSQSLYRLSYPAHKPNKMSQVKCNKVDLKTLRIRCQFLHVSAPKCHSQGLYQRQSFVSPTHISGASCLHFRLTN